MPPEALERAEQLRNVIEQAEPLRRSVGVMLTEALHVRLHSEAKRTARSMSYVARKAVEEYLRKRKR